MIYYENERANPKGGIYHQHNRGLCCSSHLHDSFEWIYVYRGELRVTVDGKSFPVHSGESILVFPNQIHSCVTVLDSETYLCIFQNSLVGEFAGIAKNTAAENPVFPLPDTTLIDRLQTTDHARYRLKSHLYELIDRFDRTSGGYRARSGKPTEHVGQILTYIASHCAEAITMQDVAKKIGYDHHYLSWLLQKNLHTTFRTLLNEYRISHAQALLLSDRERSIATIAAECGYDSLCSFNRNFKQVTKTTPSAYRLSHL